MRRSLGDAQTGAAVITPELLLMIRNNLSLTVIEDLCIWNTCLIVLYGMLRPGNILHSGKYVENRDIQVRDVHYNKKGYIVELKWTKQYSSGKNN